MTSNRIAELLARKLAGEATVEELNEMEEYLRHHSEEQYFQEMLTDWWKMDDAKKPEMKTWEGHFQHIMEQAHNDLKNENEVSSKIILINRKRLWKRFLVAAAIVAIVSLTMWKFLDGSSKPVNNFISDNEIVAKRGTKSKLLLPDGTQVWLNSDSRLIYTHKFNSDSVREVTLDGEAFFDVVKNAKRPFIVHTSAINIRVLGTAFNVKSYAQDPTIEATLVRGLIEVKKNNEPRSSGIFLRPNQKLVYNKTEGKLPESPARSETQTVVSESSYEHHHQQTFITVIPKNITDSNRIETSWVYGKLLFEGDSFSELARKMERWFNIRIVFADDKVKNYRFRGVFENENIEEALHALQLTSQFQYSINGDDVVISKK